MNDECISPLCHAAALPLKFLYLYINLGTCLWAAVFQVHGKSQTNQLSITVIFKAMSKILTKMLFKDFLILMQKRNA
jgi:hypothetical protein